MPAAVGRTDRLANGWINIRVSHRHNDNKPSATVAEVSGHADFPSGPYSFGAAKAGLAYSANKGLVIISGTPQPNTESPDARGLSNNAAGLRYCSTGELNCRIDECSRIELHIAHFVIDNQRKGCRRLPNRKAYIYCAAIDDGDYVARKSTRGNNVGHRSQPSFNRSAFFSMTAKYPRQRIQPCFYFFALRTGSVHLMRSDLQIFDRHWNRIKYTLKI